MNNPVFFRKLLFSSFQCLFISSFFCISFRNELEINFPVLKNNLHKEGILWISWPKGSSKVKTDVNENIIRESGLKEGMVDVKVCAVDEIWSGLKFVYRKADR